MEYDVLLNKTFHLKMRVCADNEEAAGKLATNEARLRMFHDVKPVIEVSEVQQVPGGTDDQ